jgi:acetyl esterase/lipase
MKKRINVEIKEPQVSLSAEIIYRQRNLLSNAPSKPLCLSIIRPRNPYNKNDQEYILPLIIWLSGGGFTTMDRNVMVPELSWFVKRGFAVASLDYTVTYRNHYPAMVEDVKSGIRFLKAHARELKLDAGRIALMGDSAGGYLASLCALTGKIREYDTGDYLDYTSEVQAAIPWYGVARPGDRTPDITKVAFDLPSFADVTQFVSRDSPPFLILHGDKDSQVPLSQAELLYDALQKAGAPADLVILEGAEHADAAFIQEEPKQLILDFLKSRLG